MHTSFDMCKIRLTSFDIEFLPCFWWEEEEYEEYDEALKKLECYNSFVHLNVHTKYSIGNGICDIKTLVSTARKYGMKAIAITDFGTMSGVYEFYTEAKRAGIKPIIGCEFYLFENENLMDKEKISLVLLAQDTRSYRGILKLLSVSDAKYGYDRPYITLNDIESLEESECDAICGLMGIGSFTINNATEDEIMDYFSAQEKIMDRCSEILADVFFTGIKKIDFPKDAIIKKEIEKIWGDDFHNPCFVYVNDIRYLNKEDFKNYNIAKCAFEDKKLYELTNGENSERYLKTVEEMIELADYKRAVQTTWTITHHSYLNFEQEKIFEKSKETTILVTFLNNFLYWQERLGANTFDGKSLLDTLINYAKEHFKCRYAEKIIAYEKYTPVEAITRTGAAMNISSVILSQIKNILPKDSVTIDEALEQSCELETLYRKKSEIRQLMDTAKVIQNLPWKFTTHKSAFVISDEPLNKYLPVRLYKGLSMIEWPLSTLKDIGIPIVNMEGLNL